MKLFEFLEKLSKERYSFTLKHHESINCITVEVDAFSEKWIVSFTEKGFLDYEIYKDIEQDDSENPTFLESLFNRPCRTWLKAAKDLDIEIVCPYVFMGSNGEKYKITGHLPQFGGGKGLLVFSYSDSDKAVDESDRAHEFSQSFLGPQYYEQYDRRKIMDLLEDWGWSGKGEPPAWFKGKRL